MQRSYDDLATKLAKLVVEIDETLAHAPMGSAELDALEGVDWRQWEDAVEDVLRGLNRAARPVTFRSYATYIGAPWQVEAA